MSNDWLSLVDAVKQDIRSMASEFKTSSAPETLYWELVDRHLPIYYYDQAMLLASNTDLGFPDDKSCLEYDNIFTMIQSSIADSLHAECLEEYYLVLNESEEGTQEDADESETE